VGWRQNEQTYDSALLSSSFGADSLKVTYAYLWDVNRIFGVKDHSKAGADFESDSHLVNANYSGLSLPGASKDAKVNLSAFAYILDFDNSPANSSDSFGFRATGKIPLEGDWNAGYGFSYAYQIDDGTNPTDYGAHYVWAEGALGYGPCGSLKLGYELLGSDDGDARFVTPLATAHKFNGWADVFLNNGGNAGLQDLYLGFAPKLPWKLNGKLVYHHFKSHHGSDTLGNEVDADLTRPFLKHFLGRIKFAYFNGDDDGSTPFDLYRVWLELTFRFSMGG
jgi:hypothetical protein